MGNIKYHDYIKSKEWDKKRKERLKVAHYQCEICYKSVPLQVHHRTYRRLGQERISDLIALCSECHMKEHSLIELGGLPEEFDKYVKDFLSPFPMPEYYHTIRIKDMSDEEINTLHWILMAMEERWQKWFRCEINLLELYYPFVRKNV